MGEKTGEAMAHYHQGALQATPSDQRDRALDKKLPTMEIFGPTIQGEGYLAGSQTHFVRFGLCDYHCRMCDSIHAIDSTFVKEHANYWTQDEIFEQVIENLPLHTPWITLSGGNPAIHNLSQLVANFQTVGWKVAIETQGTFAPNWIGALDCVTVSPKSPGMGEKFEPKKLGDFLGKFQHGDGLNIKVVVFSAQDLEFAALINEQFAIPFGLKDRFYLSLGNSQIPQIVEGKLVTGIGSVTQHREHLLNEYAILCEELTQDRRLANAKFFPQLHVLAWSNEAAR